MGVLAYTVPLVGMSLNPYYLESGSGCIPTVPLESPSPTTNAQDASLESVVAKDTISNSSEESTSLGLTTADLQPISTSILTGTANMKYKIQN